MDSFQCRNERGLLPLMKGWVIMCLMLHFACTLSVNAAQSEAPCHSKLSEPECRTLGSRCEWVRGSLCEQSCSGIRSRSACLILEKCTWNADSSTCFGRTSGCARWDDRRTCEADILCSWNEEERLCDGAVLEASTDQKNDDGSIESSEEVNCLSFTKFEECISHIECSWSDGICSLRSAVLAPKGPNSDEVRPKPTFTIPCNDASSKEACESQSGNGITCTYSDNTCRAVVDNLSPSARPITGSSLLWLSVYSGIAVVSVSLVIIWKMQSNTCTPRPENIKAMQCSRFVVNLLALVLLAVSDQGRFVIVPILVASLVTITSFSVLLTSFDYPGLRLFNGALFMTSFGAAGATTGTSSAFMLSAAVLLAVGFLLLVVENGLVVIPKVKQHWLLPHLLRIGSIFIAVLYIGLWSWLQSPARYSDFHVMCMFLLLSLQFLTIILNYFKPEMAILGDSACLVPAILASADASYNIARLHLIFPLLSLFAAGFMGILWLLTLDSISSPGKQQNVSTFRSSKASQPVKRSPSKHKVFTQPQSGDISAMRSSNNEDQSASRLFEHESFIVYLESSLNSSYNSQQGERDTRRRGSSVDYKREMALV